MELNEAHLTNALKAVARGQKPNIKAGFHSDGRGLYLRVSKAGAMSWSFRWKPAGCKIATEVGLGSFTGQGSSFRLTLKQARLAADARRAMLERGQDPRAVKKAERASSTTFGELLEAHIATSKTGPKAWSVDRKGACATEKMWRSVVRIYAPKLAAAPINRIDRDLVVSLLQAAWQSHQAEKLRQYIETIIDIAKAKGLFVGENPARWEGCLEPILKHKPSKSKNGGQKALDHSQLPAVMKQLASIESIAGQAVRFAILTAARRDEAREAMWSEIDLEARLWTVPAKRMKMKRDHVVPLSAQAVALLKALPRIEGNPFVFPGAVAAEPISATAVGHVVDVKLGLKGEATLHGMRTTFSSFIAAKTGFSAEEAELQLAHKVQGVRGIYQRDPLIEKRFIMVTVWGNYCDGQAADVLDLNAFRKVS